MQARRELQWQRLETLLHALWPAAVQGDVKAAREATRVMERQARLMGLDEPVLIDAKVDVTVQDISKAQAAALEKLSTEKLLLLLKLNDARLLAEGAIDADAVKHLEDAIMSK